MPLDPEMFLTKFRLQLMVTELTEGGKKYAYQVRFRRESDKSTISMVMRTPEPPTVEQAIEELKWLFSVTDHSVRTWNRLAEFFTEDEIALLKETPENGLDAMVSSA